MAKSNDPQLVEGRLALRFMPFRIARARLLRGHGYERNVSKSKNLNLLRRKEVVRD